MIGHIQEFGQSSIDNLLTITSVINQLHGNGEILKQFKDERFS